MSDEGTISSGVGGGYLEWRRPPSGSISLMDALNCIRVNPDQFAPPRGGADAGAGEANRGAGRTAEHAAYRLHDSGGSEHRGIRQAADRARQPLLHASIRRGMPSSGSGDCREKAHRGVGGYGKAVCRSMG